MKLAKTGKLKLFTNKTLTKEANLENFTKRVKMLYDENKEDVEIRDIFGGRFLLLEQEVEELFIYDLKDQKVYNSIAFPANFEV